MVCGLALFAAGCATTGHRLADRCTAGPGKGFIGKKADAITGAALLEATNTTELRWVPPRTIVTTEYKYGRLSVGFDDTYTITGVSCG